MIEISEEKYWKKLNYYDGLLYLSLLEIDGKTDWRMISYDDHIPDGSGIYNNYRGSWWVVENGTDFDYLEDRYFIIPVRDI